MVALYPKYLSLYKTWTLSENKANSLLLNSKYKIWHYKTWRKPKTTTRIDVENFIHEIYFKYINANSLQKCELLSFWLYIFNFDHHDPQHILMSFIFIHMNFDEILFEQWNFGCFIEAMEATKKSKLRTT